MKAVKATFDGKRVFPPADIQNQPPGDVIVIFESGSAEEIDQWLAGQEEVLKQVWDNPLDAEYDRL